MKVQRSKHYLKPHHPQITGLSRKSGSQIPPPLSVLPDGVGKLAQSKRKVNILTYLTTVVPNNLQLGRKFLKLRCLVPMIPSREKVQEAGGVLGLKSHWRSQLCLGMEVVVVTAI
jgi:hypothetical protein